MTVCLETPTSMTAHEKHDDPVTVSQKHDDPAYEKHNGS